MEPLRTNDAPPTALMLGLLWPVMILAVLKLDPHSRIGTRPDPHSADFHFHNLQSRVNPNRAPWWEIAVLPGIGETRAKVIVAARSPSGEDAESRSNNVYRSLHDLDRIPGIGPKTMERLAEVLEF